MTTYEYMPAYGIRAVYKSLRFSYSVNKNIIVIEKKKFLIVLVLYFVFGVNLRIYSSIYT